MSRRMEMKLDPEEDKLLLPSSSEDEEEESSNSGEESEDEPMIEDPFAKVDDDSDSDGAPEALSFKAVSEEVHAKRLQMAQATRTLMLEKKKRRKEIHEEFLLKKKEEEQKIESKMLPNDFLENLDDDSFPITFKSLVGEKDESETDEIKDTGAGSSEKETSSTKEVVAIHGPTVFQCKALKEESRKPRYVPESVMSFKDKRLYGGRIRRERSARDAVLKVTKQRARRVTPVY